MSSGCVKTSTCKVAQRSVSVTIAWAFGLRLLAAGPAKWAYVDAR